MLCIYQYSVHNLYKQGLFELFIVYWPSRHNNVKYKDREILGINISLHTINTTVGILKFMHIEDIKAATEEDTEFQTLKRYIIRGCQHYHGNSGARGRQVMPYEYELAIIDGTALKVKHIIIPYFLWRQILQQLHSNHLGIEKTFLLAGESVYWINMNSDVM